MSADLLNQVVVDAAIWERYPSYTAQLLVISNIANQPSNEFSEDFLASAEQAALTKLQQTKLDDLVEVQLWRETFSSFGVKPRDGRSSFEALLRRVDKGLPRINLLTDLYNALSIKYLMPIGGENFDHYQGAPRLTFATGNETFDTTANGEPVVVQPDPGEVIWRDDAGVTCRRWNWRQCVRTRLEVDTTSALFIFDGLGEDSKAVTAACATELIGLTEQIWPDQQITTVTLSATK
jgi:DNA/RNA-binding domain of Phe-tRNA-synthetase-like protein